MRYDTGLFDYFFLLKTKGEFRSLEKSDISGLAADLTLSG